MALLSASLGSGLTLLIADRKDGTTWIRWAIRPWQNLDGEQGGILIFSEDITRRKLAEEALSDMSRKLIDAHGTYPDCERIA